MFLLPKLLFKTMLVPFAVKLFTGALNAEAFLPQKNSAGARIYNNIFLRCLTSYWRRECSNCNRYQTIGRGGGICLKSTVYGDDRRLLRILADVLNSESYVSITWIYSISQQK